MFRLFILLISLSLPLFAGVTIMEQSPGSIRLRLTADTIQTKNHTDTISIGTIADITVSDDKGSSIPAFKLQLFSGDREKTTISVNVLKKVSIPYSGILRKSEPTDPILSGISSKFSTSYYRFSPVNYCFVTPILSTDNGILEQFTEAEVTIKYTPISRADKPDGDYESAVAGVTLNPNEFYRVMPIRSRSTTDNDLWLGSNEKALTFSVGGKAGTLAETADTTNHLIKITPSDLKLLTNNPLSTSEIAIYATNTQIFDENTPDINTIPSSLVSIPYILRDKNNNGVFDNNDVILFYATGPHYWYRSKKHALWQYSFNPFTAKRNYYITQSTSVFASKATLPTVDGTATASGIQLRQVRQANDITTKGKFAGNSSREWIWTSLKPGNQTFRSSILDLYEQTPGTTSSLTLLYPVQSGTQISGSFNFVPNGDTTVTLYSTERTVKLPAGTEEFRVTTPSIQKDQYIDIQGYSIKYFRNLVLNGSSLLHFYAGDTTGSNKNALYTVSGLPADFTTILRVDAHLQTIELIDTITSTTGTFSWNDAKGAPYEYVVATESGALPPANLTVLSPEPSPSPSSYRIRDLHAATNKSDYMIITPSIFLNQAESLAAHKISTNRFKQPTIVTTEDIYREFSGGTAQPTAIRNFMTYVTYNWGKVDYLILLGNGHYDYKGIKSGAEQNFIPPMVTSDHGDDNPAVEDFFAYTTAQSSLDNSNSYPSLAVGRVAARSISEMDGFIDKLKLMEGQYSDNSEWRNQQLLISDDDFQGSTPDGIEHWESSDSASDIILQNSPTVNIQKVNLFEFPRSGTLKPAAKDALINYLNNGVGAVNYFGHGSYNAITDEQMFGIDDISKLTNYKRYHIFSAFSCDVGFFDMPGIHCIASDLIVAPNRGAIASVASTRVAYAGPNADFAKLFFASYYSLSNPKTIGKAYIEAKFQRNLKHYALFGDPSYRPLAKNVSVEPIISAKSGTTTDTIKGAQTIIVGAKMPADWKIDSARIHIQLPEKTTSTRKDGLGNTSGIFSPYKLPGTIVVNRAVAVQGDSIYAVIKMPPFSTGTIDSLGIRIYGWNNSQPQTITAIKRVTYAGIDPTGIDTTDKTGPGIAVRLYQDTAKYQDTAAGSNNTIIKADTIIPGSTGNKIVIDGFPKSSTDITSKPVAVELYFSDSSSIDVSGINPGEGITVEIPGVRSIKSYNDNFVPIKDNPSKGRVILYLNANEFPAPGEYKMIVSASDFLQNRTKTEYTLDIRNVSDGVYDIGNFYAYPSPAYLGESTRFYFNIPNFTSTINDKTKKPEIVSNAPRMTLKIFTLSGQLVRQFNDVRPGVVWDLTDQSGNKLSPNVYLYRLYVERTSRPESNSIDNGIKKEQIRSEIRKMAIYPPR